MAVTTSFHMGSTVSLRHNARDPKLCRHESHIDLTGDHSARGVGVDGMTLRDSYEDIFGEAVREYNERQKRADRKIDSYYDSIAKEEQSDKRAAKHLVYEAIMTVGSHKNYNDCFTDDEQIDPQEAKRMLFEAVNEIESRYGEHIRIVGVYWHNDESRLETINGEHINLRSAPHVHIDYVPVATDYKRGMSVQNAQRRAFEQLGFAKSKRGGEAPQVQFNRACRKILDEVVYEHGYEVSHPIAEKKEREREHLSNYHYKMYKKHEALDQIDFAISRGEESVERIIRNRDHAYEQKREALEERDSARAERDEAETIGRVMDSVKNADKNEILETLETAEPYEMRSGALGRTRTDMVRMTPEAYETVKENIKALSDGTALYEAISDAREGIRQYSEEANINRLKAIDTEVEKRTERYRSERDEARASQKAMREKYNALEYKNSQLEEKCSQLEETNSRLKRRNNAISGENIELSDENSNLKKSVSKLKDTNHKLNIEVENSYWKGFREGFKDGFNKAREGVMSFVRRAFRFNVPEKAATHLINDFEWEHEHVREFEEASEMNDESRKEEVARQYMDEYEKHGINEPNTMFENFCRELEERKKQRYYDEWER